MPEGVVPVAGWITVLTTAGNVVGAALILGGAVRFLASGSVPALLIALAVLVVGPGEDMLKRWVRGRAVSQEEAAQWETLVDRATSLIFLVLLLAAIVLV